nr:uncharacterized membrane protein At3g27390 [Tanacetum cinerariifolium]
LRYQQNVKTSDGLDRMASIGNDFKNITENIRGSRLVSQCSKTLKQALQQYTPVQVWDWLFKSCQVNGKILFRDGLIDVKDIEECIVKGRCKNLAIKLPAWSIMQCLLASAKSESSGLVISDELVMKYQNVKPEDWDDSGFPSNDHVRRAQLQAIIRRLQGIVGSMSRMPTFRRKFKNLVKVLYLEALQAGIIATPPEGGDLKRRLSGQGSIEKAGVKHLTVNKEEKLNDAQVTEDWASLSKMHERLAIHLATRSPFEPSNESVGLTAPRVLFLLLSEFEQIFIMYVNQKTFDAAYDEQKSIILQLRCEGDGHENTHNLTSIYNKFCLERLKLFPNCRLKNLYDQISHLDRVHLRMPTFRRKFKNLVKVLYLEALQARIIATPPKGGGLKRRLSGQGSIEKASVKHITVNKEEKLNDAQVPEDVV